MLTAFKLSYTRVLLPCMAHIQALTTRRVARNSQWGANMGVWRPIGVWGKAPSRWRAGGQGANPPAAEGTGVWGQSPQRSKILHFFAKIA